MRNGLRLGAVGLGLALAACSTDTGPTAEESLLNQDVATVAGEVAAQDVELMRGPGGLFGFHLAAVPGRFECTSHDWGPVTVARTCTFLDASGTEQPAYDPLTTASVHVHFEVSVAVDRDHWSGSLERVRDFTVSGLEGEEATITWNGTGSGTVTRVRETRDGETRQFDLTQSVTVTDVVIPVPRTENGWPLSGTITSSVTVTFTGGPRDGTVEQRDVTITFTGTSVVQVTVNGETFDFDLATRTRAHHRDRP